MNELQDETLQLVNENFRKVLREIATNPKGGDKYALMDLAKDALRNNQQEVSSTSNPEGSKGEGNGRG